MSVTRITSIHCDDCGAWSYSNGTSSEGTATEIRRMLKRQGWRVAQDGRDYCPECASSN